MHVTKCEILVVGAGPGGLAAAKRARDTGASSVIVLERDKKPGGILNQCIHDGFGLIRYQQALTGPEYAAKVSDEAIQSGAEILTCHHVKNIDDKNVMVYTRSGIKIFSARSIILATGCRERTRGTISIPGSRPAGIFTAGVAQNLVNMKNVMPGKRVVILGSGDIGLIMARRLTLEGARVLEVAEILSEPCGLARNVRQCLYDFNIPLSVNTTVTNIMGKRKLQAVELSRVDEDLRAIPNTARILECDALILSVGLIPENEIAQTAGVMLNADNSVKTDEFLQTNIAGIFSCGNSRHVMDLADYVSEQGELAGENAVHYINHEPLKIWDEGRTNCMKKGFPDKDTITCTICPNGCQVKWNSVDKIYTGNKCARGVAFAEAERTNPKRIVTTTIRLENNSVPLISVRTANAINMNNVMNFMERVKDISLNSVVKRGDLAASININGEDINIIATS